MGLVMANKPYVQLCLGERQTLIRLRMQGHSLRAIGKILGRAHTTIARELARNTHHNGDHEYYTYTKAQEKAMGRRTMARKKSQFTDAHWKMVDDHIRKDWSPEQTAHVLRREDALYICHESIYQHIYKDKANGDSLYIHLMLRCRKRRKRYRSKDSRGILRGKTMIEQRPQDINDRLTVGHWEIDTVM